MSRYRDSTSTLYVRNISDRARYDDLRHLFGKYGRVLDVTIPVDYYTRQPRGYCFVQYEDSRDADEAQYRLHGRTLFGKEIEVEFARGDRKTPGEMRSRVREQRPHRDNYKNSSRSRSRSPSVKRKRRSYTRSRSENREHSEDKPSLKDRSRSPREQSRENSAEKVTRQSRTRSRSTEYVYKRRSRSHSREN